MNLDTFFEKFELFADAPDAVAKMRELVLELAVRGGLSKSLSADEQSREWQTFVRAADERDRDKNLDLRPPFDVRPTWRWTCLDDIGTTKVRCELADNARVSFVPMALISSDYAVPVQSEERTWSEIKKGFTHFGEGDVVMAKITPCFENAKSAVMRGLKNRAGAGTTELHVFRPNLALVVPEFALIYLKTRGYITRGETLMTGSAGQKRVPRDYFAQSPFPLPPIAEQKRIVEKVDELMALCDRLEAQQQERKTRHAALARASLSRFADAPTPANLEFIFHKSYDITPADLRKTILTLAVQGKLVPQDPNDEPAEQLVAQLSAEKCRLVQAKEIKSETPLPAIASAEVFPIPKNWIWIRAGDLCRPISSGSTPDQSVFHHTDGVPYLKVYNIRNQLVDFDFKRQFIAANHHREKMRRSTLHPGDVIMNIVGPPLGKVAIVPDSYPEWNCNQAISFFRPVFPAIAPFLYLFLKEGSFLQNIQLIGTAGQDNISVTKCKFIPVPVPPLAEQRRIVARVEQLMLLVDELESKLSNADKAATALLEAIIHELVAPASQTIETTHSMLPQTLDRAAIGCYAIKQLAEQRYFGRTAAAKVFYLAEAHLGLELGGKYLRDAAGPFDQSIYRFEEEAARHDWFTTVEVTTSDRKPKIEYRKGKNLDKEATKAANLLGDARRIEFDRLLSLLKARPTKEVEAIAMLFAAWNDFLIDGRTPSDPEIVREVRENWHPKKRSFTESELNAWLAWMRQNSLVPKGIGPRTVGEQSKLALH
jgi:type I restriction enzyme, S subunit